MSDPLKKRHEGDVVELGGVVQLPPLRGVSGRWYFVAHCTRCWEVTPVIVDPAEGGGGRRALRGPGRVSTSCQRCGESFLARPEDLVSVRWP